MRNKKIGMHIALILIISFVFNSNVFAESLSVYTAQTPEEMEKAIMMDKSGEINETVEAKVIVNENNIKREADDRMLGVQCDIFEMSDYLLGTKSTDLSDKYKAFAKQWFKAPVFRWGGTSAERFNPMNNIGPVEKRKGSTFLPSSMSDGTGKPFEGRIGVAAQMLGPVEFIKMAQATNPNFEYIPNLSMNVSTPEDNANFASFLTHKASESEWGALRASYGIVEPINVPIFELGNELDIVGGTDTPYAFNQKRTDWYIDIAKKNIDAIKKVVPNAKFAVVGKSSPWGEDPAGKESWRRWTIAIAEALGGEFDFMAWHTYYDGIAMSGQEGYYDEVMEDLKTVLGPNHGVKFIFTEHAIWNDPINSRVNSLDAALSVAQFFNRVYQRDDVWGATYHNIFSGNNLWSLYQYRDDEFMETVVSKMYRVYQKGLGDRIVESNVESDSVITDLKSSRSRFSVLATPKGKRELNLILNNDDPNVDFNLTFDLKNQYTLVEETVFTAPNIDSFVYNKNTKDVSSDITTEKNEKNFTKYHMPNKSLVILKLVSSSDLPLFGENVSGNGSNDDDVEYIETSFTDIENHWARNEIAKMRELGYINGVSANAFEPEKNITRAEYAVIIARMLKFDTGYDKSFFSDVSDDEWYSKYINASYIEGVLKGNNENKFNANDNITLEEMIVSINRAYRKYKQDNILFNSNEILKDFKNLGSISDWAKEDIAFAAQKGILYRLYENGCFEPQSMATRAETASILYRLYNLIN